jgi:hypothetical protein
VVEFTWANEVRLHEPAEDDMKLFVKSEAPSASVALNVAVNECPAVELLKTSALELKGAVFSIVTFVEFCCVPFSNPS